ncbi:NADH-quinone oxidoreductase subunit L [subsurface metagenome]
MIFAIILLPLFSFLVISFVLRPFFNNRPQLSAYTTICAIVGSLILSIWALIAVNGAENHVLTSTSYQWLAIGDTVINIGITMDSLAAIMVVTVSTISLLVQIYSIGYMKGDGGFARYFAFMSLFTASMLGLVLADNLLFLFLFWEGVGLCSYLLIGFWFHKPEAARAAMKAFVVTRLGDFGFLVAIIFLYVKTGTFDIGELHELALAGVLGGSTLTLAAIGIFSGAVGKSGQFPLHTWLPDAMEGPTPVSALIHAATMVTAGVYLVARMFPMIASSETAITVVAIIGGFTAIFAATMGLVATDIKRVLAYSTISQLGYMMLGLGAVGIGYASGHLDGHHALTLGVAVAIFHLFTHAFFKSLLFLGSGSTSHATGTFDMRKMGGLRKVQPWTYVTFVIGSLSLAGIWPLAGFWSKEGILHEAHAYTPVLFWLAMITVFMTAFYMFRAVFLTFHGEYRGGKEGSHSHGLHESPKIIIIPLVILAIFAVIAGWLPVGDFLGADVHFSFFGALTSWLAWASLSFGIAGILLAYIIYVRKLLSAKSIGQSLGPVYTLLIRKYFFDELYERFFVMRFLVDGIFAAFQWVDTYIVDGSVNGIATITVAGGKVMRRLETGQLQVYGLAIFIGILAIVAFLFIFS